MIINFEERPPSPGSACVLVFHNLHFLQFLISQFSLLNSFIFSYIFHPLVGWKETHQVLTFFSASFLRAHDSQDLQVV